MLDSNRLIESHLHMLCFNGKTNAMAETIWHSQVEEMNSLVTELVKVTANEQVLLEQCKDFLSTLAAMQVNLALIFFLIIQLLLSDIEKKN